MDKPKIDMRDNGDSDCEEIAKAINWFMVHGHHAGIASTRGASKVTVSGYFDFEHQNRDDRKQLRQLSGKCVRGVTYA